VNRSPQRTRWGGALSVAVVAVGLIIAGVAYGRSLSEPGDYTSDSPTTLGDGLYVALMGAGVLLWLAAAVLMMRARARSHASVGPAMSAAAWGVGLAPALLWGGVAAIYSGGGVAMTVIGGTGVLFAALAAVAGVVGAILLVVDRRKGATPTSR